ncbi:MAG: D-2-hydroxyacid dehydrogenase [Roseovarius sp.]
MTQAPKVIVLNDDPNPLVARLNEAMPDVVATPCDSYDAMHTLVPQIKPDVIYSVTFAGRAGFPLEALLGSDAPAWISVGGSGCDHLGTWDAQRVTVTNAAGVASAAMAEYVFGTVLHYTLDIEGLMRDKAAQHWDLSRMVQPLQGKTMLIVGLGQTGQAVAQRAKAFDMHVLGARARPQPMPHVDEVHPSDALSDLWPRADVIVVCVPLLASTRGMIDARAFAAMKPEAMLVDVSRGGVVDNDALINALRSGAIAHAALDVFPTEPLPADSPMWALEGTIISPHSSAVFEQWAARSFELFVENLARWRAGDPLHNIVDPSRGY